MTTPPLPENWKKAIEREAANYSNGMNLVHMDFSAGAEIWAARCMKLKAALEKVKYLVDTDYMISVSATKDIDNVADEALAELEAEIDGSYGLERID